MAGRHGLGKSAVAENPQVTSSEGNVTGPLTVPTPWGLASSIDIYDCDPETIRRADRIHEFVVELCELIGMKRFGEAQVIHFGGDERVAGFSMVQLIETSLISGHFANQSNTAYLDVFSCGPYDPEVAGDFAQRFFGGSRRIIHVNPRL